MAVQVWVLLLFALLLGVILGVGVVTRKTRREVVAIRQQRDKLTADMLDFQHGLRDQLLDQMALCTENVRTLYTTRQEDATRYTKAMNASLQLVSEVLVAVANAETSIKRVGPVSPAVAAELSAIRQLCNEMRKIMSGVTFDELARVVASLSAAERHEISVYQAIAAREQDRVDQLDVLRKSND